MSEKIRVGILGSCVTREVFTTYYNDYKNHFDLIFSHERESLISLFQDPIEFDEEDIKIYPDSKKNRFRSKNIFNDLSKSFFEDLKRGIDYLIIDVYFEALFGIMVLENGSIITNNKWDLPKTKFYNDLNNYTICDMYENQNEFFELWITHCNKLFEFLKSSYPGVKIILNKVKLADKVLKEDYSFYVDMDFKWMVQTYYPFIQKFEEYIEENFDVLKIEYDGMVFTNVNNRWSPYVVHLTDEYYNFVYYSICKLVNIDNSHLHDSKLKYISSKLPIYENILNNVDGELTNMANKIIELNNLLEEKECMIIKYENELNYLKDFKEDILNSSSWKITKPFRYLKNSVDKTKK